MDIKIQGGVKIAGEITPSGSKNSTVALIPASILFEKSLKLTNVPDITDVNILLEIINALNGKVDWDKEKNTISIDNSKLKYKKLGGKNIESIRGSSLFWGPLLAQFGKVEFDELPGGCTLGTRSLQPHFEAFAQMNISIEKKSGGIVMDAKNIKSGTIWLSEMSPTVTENVLMLASKLEGITKIIGAASEPHVQDLCLLLIKGGCKIKGIGSSVLEITGKKSFFSNVTHPIISDHYEIGTFLAIASITKGTIKVHKALPEYFDHINYIFKKFGVDIKYQQDTAFLNGSYKNIPSFEKTTVVKAQPWPGLPVDMLPLFIPLAINMKKSSFLFHNWMYERGLYWVEQLEKLGAKITICDPHRVIITGENKLSGTTITAPYIIRAVIAMVMVGLIADGETVIQNADAISRGHPNFIENLNRLGAKITAI